MFVIREAVIPPADGSPSFRELSRKKEKPIGSLSNLSQKKRKTEIALSHVKLKKKVRR